MSAKAKRIFWILFLIVLLALAAVIYVLPGISDFFTATSVVTYGEIVQKTETDAWIVRTEHVLTCPAGGALQTFFEEGERVRKSSKVAEIFPGSVAVTADDGGILSYYVDGLETVLTPDTMKTVSRQTAESWQSEPVYCRTDAVEAGKTLFKIVDGDCWYLLFWTDAADAAHYSKGKTVTVTLPAGEVEAIVDTIENDGENDVRILLRTSRYYSELGKSRRVPVSVLTSDRSGLLIRNDAMTVEQDLLGVYVKQVGGNFAFVPVNVLSTDGTYSVVSEGSYTRTNAEGTSVTQKTVNAYDEILNRPEKK